MKKGPYTSPMRPGGKARQDVGRRIACDSGAIYLDNLITGTERLLTDLRAVRLALNRSFNGGGRPDLILEKAMMLISQAEQNRRMDQGFAALHNLRHLPPVPAVDDDPAYPGKDHLFPKDMLSGS